MAECVKYYQKSTEKAQKREKYMCFGDLKNQHEKSLLRYELKGKQDLNRQNITQMGKGIFGKRKTMDSGTKFGKV